MFGPWSARAADYPSSLGPDLTGALRHEIAGGVRTAFGRDKSRLLGSVRLLDASNSLLASYQIQIEAGTAAETRTGALARASVTTADGFYRDLVGTFARTTREQILRSDLPGERIVRNLMNG